MHVIAITKSTAHCFMVRASTPIDASAIIIASSLDSLGCIVDPDAVYIREIQSEMFASYQSRMDDENDRDLACLASLRELSECTI